MKQVTIDTVRERIAELDCLRGDGVLSLRGEFELACLRMLVASMDVKPFMYGIADPDGAAHMDECCVSTSMAGIEDYVHMLNEECEEGGPLFTVVALYTAPPAQVTSVYDDVRNVVGHVQPVPVTEWEEGSEPPAFGKYYVRYMTDTGPRFCIAEWLEYDCCVPNRHMVKMWLADHSRSMNALQGVTHFTRLPEWSEPQEPDTDNTAQQFEALATSAGSGKP